MSWDTNSFNFSMPSLQTDGTGLVNLTPTADTGSGINIGSLGLGSTGTPTTGGFFDRIGSGFNSMSKSMGMSPMSLGLAGIQGIGSLVGGYNGYKQYKLAKDQFNFQKSAWNSQYAAQRGLVNSQLEDRQKQRVARDPNALSVSEYMTKYGIK